MVIEKYIRKMARSHYWQQLYNSSKEVNGVTLFYNQTNFSGIQNLFLYWLKVYNMLYEEKSMKEWDNLTDDVIDDDDRTDAFLYWRSKKMEAKIIKNQTEQRKMKNQNRGIRFPIYKGKQKGDK